MPLKFFPPATGGTPLKKKSQTFTSDGTFIVPPAIKKHDDGNHYVWVTATGGGGSGCAVVGYNGCSGGQGGEYCIHYRISVTPEETISVTIGSYGSYVSATGYSNEQSLGNPGGATSFGVYLTLAGGAGGQYMHGAGYIIDAWGEKHIDDMAMPGASLPKSGDILSETTIMGGSISGGNRRNLTYYWGERAGESLSGPVLGYRGGMPVRHDYGSGTVSATGGGAGIFGQGGNARATHDSNVYGGHASWGSGGGGGGALTLQRYGGPYTARSGRGGGGRLLVEWHE